MNRRALLKAAPVAVVAGALPIAAQATPNSGQTPVMTMFHEWQAFHDWMNSDATYGLPEEELDALVDRKTSMEDAILDTPAQSCDDLLAKVAAYTCFGEHELPVAISAPIFWAEVRALIGGAA